MASKPAKFSVGDKVTHPTVADVCEVTAVGKEQNWPGRGAVRKVTIQSSGFTDWFWDYELEAW
jgi:hypothetical protein